MGRMIAVAKSPSFEWKDKKLKKNDKPEKIESMTVTAKCCMM